MNKPTHILNKYASQDHSQLFRASDGMRLGMQKDAVVIFGTNPNRAESAVFMNFQMAQDFLISEGLKDFKANPDKFEGQAFKVEVHDAEPTGIVMPKSASDDFSLPSYNPRLVKN